MTEHVRRYGLIFLGCLIGSLGINMFLLPGHLLSGGLSGIALILYYIWELPIGIQLLVYNLPILYLAYRVFGRGYAIDTIIGTLLFSLCVDLTSFTSQYNFVHDSMLNALFGGVVSGIGYGIVFREDANTGGPDVVGAVVKKYYSYDMGTVIFVLNALVIAVGMFLFDVETALFTLVSIYVTAELTNRVVAGFNREKTIYIISPKAVEIADEIMDRVERGVTFIEGSGGFTDEHKDILFIVVPLTEVGRVKSIVNSLDKAAFMIISDTSEVMGRGFSFDIEGTGAPPEPDPMLPVIEELVPAEENKEKNKD